MASPKKLNSSFSRGSDEDISIVCFPCHRDEAAIPAFGYCINCQEHLCHSCFIHHQKATPCRHHRLQDKDAMPSIQRLTATVIHDTMDRIDKLLKKCTITKKETSNTAKKSKDSLKKALQEITKYRQEINNRLDELQKNIEAKLQAIQLQHNEQIKTAETLCEDVRKEVKVTYDTLKQLNTSKQADQLFMEVKQTQKQLREYEQRIKSLSTEDYIGEYKFVPSHAINDVLQKEKMIGDISTKHGTRKGSTKQFNVLPSSADQSITPTCPGEICIKTSKDNSVACWISGMTVLSQDRLVLADAFNKSIKLVDVNSKSDISHLSLDKDEPWDITSTTGTQVAVTVPCRQHIQIISVSDKLSKSHTIQTDGRCWGICCHQGKLVVTYPDTAKLEILDMKGRLVTRVDTDSTGKDIFYNPGYVQANSDSIYVSENRLPEVIMLNWTGEITCKIADIGYPRGIALLGDGSLLICGFVYDNVHQVSEGCTSSRIVLQDVSHPYTVCVDGRGQKLYISRSTNDDKIDNNILVYNI